MRLSQSSATAASGIGTRESTNPAVNKARFIGHDSFPLSWHNLVAGRIRKSSEVRSHPQSCRDGPPGRLYGAPPLSRETVFRSWANEHWLTCNSEWGTD